MCISNVASARKYVLTFMVQESWTLMNFISSCYYFITSSSPPLSSPLQLSFRQASFKDIKQVHERGILLGPMHVWIAKLNWFFL
jgi:hypothetical protein